MGGEVEGTGEELMSQGHNGGGRVWRGARVRGEVQGAREEESRQVIVLCVCIVQE